MKRSLFSHISETVSSSLQQLVPFQVRWYPMRLCLPQIISTKSTLNRGVCGICICYGTSNNELGNKNDDSKDNMCWTIIIFELIDRMTEVSPIGNKD